MRTSNRVTNIQTNIEVGCGGVSPISSLYHGFMKADWSNSFKDYRRNKSLMPMTQMQETPGSAEDLEYRSRYLQTSASELRLGKPFPNGLLHALDFFGP